VTIRVGVNASAASTQLLPGPRGAEGRGQEHRHRGHRGQRPHRQRQPGAPLEVRLDPGAVPEDITRGDDTIVIGSTKIKSLEVKEGPAALPWGDLGVDVVVESTGIFTDAEKAKGHLAAGAKKVIISAPAKGEDLTIVIGVNDDKYDGSQNIISNASCTTNCLGPLAKVINDEFGLVRGLMTTVHAYTQDQNCRTARTRTCAAPAPPRSTSCDLDGRRQGDRPGAARAQGQLDGYALRVPIPTGSCTDLTVELRKSASVERSTPRTRPPPRVHSRAS